MADNYGTFARLLTRKRLEELSYRQLQQIAKANSIPCNIKKIHLREAVYLSYHGTPHELAEVLANVARERRTAKMKKEGHIKWDAFNKCLVRHLSPLDRMHLNLDKDTTVKVIKKPRAIINLTHKQPSIRATMKKNKTVKVERTEKVIIPCNRVLRNKTYPIYSNLGKKKPMRKLETSDNLVSSSGDVVANTHRGLLQRMLRERTEYKRNNSQAFAAPNVAVYVEQYKETGEPVDFSLRNDSPDASDVNQNFINEHNYEAPYYQQQSQSVLMYRQVSTTENYNRPQTDNVQSEMTVYAQNQYQNESTYTHGQYLCAHNTYAYEYAQNYKHQYENGDNRFAYECQATREVAPPYFHKKIRIERRQSEYREVKCQESTYETPTYTQNTGYLQPYENGEMQTYRSDSYIINNPDSTVNDELQRCDSGESRSSNVIYEYMTNVAPQVETVEYTEEPYVTQGGYNSGYVTNTLPSIAEAFPKYCKSTQTSCEYMRPLYVQVNDDTELRLVRHEIAVQTDENAENKEERLLKLAPTSSDISAGISASPQNVQLMVRLETVHETAEAETGLADLDTIVSRMNSPWSDVGASVTVRAPSPSWDDVMGLISQEDETVTYQMDNVQCMCCGWNGESALLEQHMREEHQDDITTYTAKVTCTHNVSLGALLREKSKAVLMEWQGKLLSLIIKYEDPEWLLASVALLTQHGEALLLHSSVTVYNKSTGEPFKWEGPVLKSNVIFYSNPTAHLKLQLSKLGLVPSEAEVLLWNGQFKPSSPNSKSICGNAALDEVMIEFHVELVC